MNSYDVFDILWQKIITRETPSDKQCIRLATHLVTLQYDHWPGSHPITLMAAKHWHKTLGSNVLKKNIQHLGVRSERKAMQLEENVANIVCRASAISAVGWFLYNGSQISNSVPGPSDDHTAAPVRLPTVISNSILSCNLRMHNSYLSFSKKSSTKIL